MIKTITPIDNTIYVERPFASQQIIDSTLNKSQQALKIWRNTSLEERKKIVEI